MTTQTNKIIITNDTDTPMADVLGYVAKVISAGRISAYGTAYCYATEFADGTVVVTKKNKASDTFVVLPKESR